MHKGGRKRITILLLVFLCSLSLFGCSKLKEEQTVLQEEGGFITLAPGAYDSADSAILMEKKEAEKKLVFYNLIRGKEYYLEYDGSTRFYDKYGSSVSVSQLAPGELVEVQFLKETRKMVTGQISDKIWTMEEVNRFDLDMTNRKIKILDEWYELSEDALIFSEGKVVELMDINAQDTLQIRGVEHEIYSIVIDKGHGYLRLTNDEYFIGGWIEVGQKVIRQIEENMLLVVPEGSYDVHLSHSGIEGVKKVEILRNQEVELDVGDIRKDDLVKYSTLIFTVEPASASVYMDGKSVDISRTVKAEYGLHQIMVKAEGYQTVIQYIKVSQNAANVSIKLDKEKDRSSVSVNSAEASVSGNTTATNSSSTQTGSSTGSSATSSSVTSSSTTGTGSTVSANTTGMTTGYKVTIDGPKGAEVYLNDTYIGIAPVSFTKKAGTHVITLRMTNYQPKSYTIELDGEQSNPSYTFPDLVPQ